MLMLHRGATVSDVARTLCCARSSVGRWINWFTLYGTDGLKSLSPGRGRRWLPAAGLVWRRAAPTLRIRDPHKDEKMAAINSALAQCSQEHPVFYEVYVDEVDIHLNPRIGADWQKRGQQKRVVTPGQNEKYYLAGALHSGTGRVSYVGGSSKSSVLFITCNHQYRSMWQLLKKVRHFMKTVSPFPGGEHGLAKV